MKLLKLKTNFNESTKYGINSAKDNYLLFFIIFFVSKDFYIILLKR